MKIYASVDTTIRAAVAVAGDTNVEPATVSALGDKWATAVSLTCVLVVASDAGADLGRSVG